MKIIWYTINMKALLYFILSLLLVSCSYIKPINEVSATLLPTITLLPTATMAKVTSTPTATIAITHSPSPTPFERTDVMNNPKIIIYKSKRILYVYDGDKLCAKIQIAISSVPIGHKLKQGDKKVPEGEYYICTKNNKSKYHLALALSYPNIKDAKVGLDSGLISKQDYDRIYDAISNGLRPPWDTALGGEIMIHGSDISKDWTAGCIAAQDTDVDYLWENCPIGTPVVILP